MINRYGKNEIGRDYVVGDIHGCFSALQAELDKMGFDPEVDRLFTTGDLVDRGPESDQVLSWLAKPWFHPVRGNHDDYVVRYKTCDHDNWVYNGGAWFQGVSEFERQEYADAFGMLPHAIEVETTAGLVGIVHADPVVDDWSGIESQSSTRRGADLLMWSRKRIEDTDTTVVAGVVAVVCGHTPLKDPVALGNVLHIDTAGWHQSGRFTIIDLADLKEIVS